MSSVPSEPNDPSVLLRQVVDARLRDAPERRHHVEQLLGALEHIAEQLERDAAAPGGGRRAAFGAESARVLYGLLEGARDGSRTAMYRAAVRVRRYAEWVANSHDADRAPAVALCDELVARLLPPRPER